MKNKPGAYFSPDGICEFRVWAPLREDISLKIVSGRQREVPMEKDAAGYFSVTLDEVGGGDRYLFRLDKDMECPDPASFFQPEDVMGPSCVFDHTSFKWADEAWQPVSPGKMIIYELHVGTFTKDGDFDGVIEKLPYLQGLGINSIELMPVSQFPGARNWGYDGVYPFAVQSTYGGPEGLKRLVNECHKRGISVILDVVYNHLGPEGNFLHRYMPCFTEKYKTPWGKAINFDDAYSSGVRDYFTQNALYWLEHFHIDALRLDAVHGIFDMSAKHILKQISESVKEFSKLNGRERYLIAESDLNDPRVIEPYSRGGYGIDAQWNDDFHHSLHSLLTKEEQGYYRDFGDISQMAKALKDGFVYAGEYSSYRRKYHGASSEGIPSSRFVVFSQNHDQIGNRMKAERLSSLVSFEALKLAAGTVLLSGGVPLLFMGEEYGEDAPFFYFMSFSDSELVEAVREGRKKEFSEFKWRGEPEDPYDEKTFLRSKMQWDKVNSGHHAVMLKFYKTLIKTRKLIVAGTDDKDSFDAGAIEENKIITITHRHERAGFNVVLSFNRGKALHTPAEFSGCWKRKLVSSAEEWSGPGTDVPEEIVNNAEFTMEPLSFAVFEREK